MKKTLLSLFLALLAICVIVMMPQKAEAADLDRYGYSVLETDKQKELYVLMVDAIAVCKEELTFSGSHYTQNDLLVVDQMIRRDYPEYFYYTQCSYSVMTDNILYSLQFHYSLNGQWLDGSSAELKTAIHAVAEKVQQITKNVQGTDFEKALFLHDYIVENTNYISTVNDQTAYGALIDQKAVCAGYSHAYQLLLRAVGIESFYVTGMSMGIPHAWLLVFLDGDCYYTDVTWDDPVTQDGSNALSHYYFDMSYDDISKDHIFDDEYHDWLPEKHDHHELYYYEHEAKEGSGVGWFNSTTEPSELYKYLKKVGNTYVCEFRFDGNDAGDWMGKAVNDAAYKIGATSASVRQLGSEYMLTLNVPAPTIVASGTCGENLTWTLDSTGTLTISGTGAMVDELSPWYASSVHHQIKNVIIENGVTTIGSYAFYDCQNLKSITIPHTVTTVGDYAFWYCWNLTGIELPDEITVIGDSAFSGCWNLVDLSLPDGLISIKSNAFNECSYLKEIVIPNGVTMIEAYTFNQCTSLESVTIPESVKSIGEGAFNWCSDLTDVYYGGSELHWNAVALAPYNAVLKEATIHFTDNPCADGNQDGKCDVCGADLGPVMDNKTKFSSTGLSLGEFIGLQNAILKRKINGGNFDEAYFIYTHHTRDENGNPNVVTKQGSFIDMGTYFVADCKVNAKQMSDVFELTPYYSVDGVTYCGVTTVTSVKAEVMRLLNDAKTEENKKALCVAMLNYGTEAQKKFSYNLGSPANDQLTATQRILPVFEDLNLSKSNNIPAGIGKPTTSGLSLGDVVYMQFLVKKTDLDNKGTLKYQISEETVIQISASELETYGNDYYLINLPIKAKNVRSSITIAFCDAKGSYTYAMVCSVEAFAKTMKGSANEALVAALMAYGDAAKAVFR